MNFFKNENPEVYQVYPADFGGIWMKMKEVYASQQ